jgi:signal transduction histidine kinase/ligand-binding sensor domain-containing protein
LKSARLTSSIGSHSFRIRFQAFTDSITFKRICAGGSFTASLQGAGDVFTFDEIFLASMIPLRRQVAKCAVCTANFIRSVSCTLRGAAARKGSIRIAERIVFCAALNCILSGWSGSVRALNAALDVSQYGHTALRSREGFAQGRISTLAQTPDGCLWLGTEFGLLRFDGLTNIPWQPPRGMSLPDNRIRVLLATRDGTLWIGTWSGLARWSAGSLITYSELDGRVVNAVLQDREGTVWVTGSTPTTGYLCAIRSGGIECNDNSSFPRGAGALWEDSNGRLWVVAGNGVWRWKPGPPRLYPIPVSGGLQGLSETSDGIVALTNKGARLITDKEVIEFPLPGTRGTFPPKSILRDRDGALWIGFDGGGLLHLHGGRTDAFGRASGLSGDVVSSLFEDREGNVWVATEQGLDRFRALAATTYSASQGLIGNTASILADRNGEIWLSSSAGLYKWHDRQLSVYRNGHKLPSQVESASEVEVDERVIRGLPEDTLGSLYLDRQDRVWIGTGEGTGYIDNDRFMPVAGVPGGYIDSFAEDKEGNLWIAHRDVGLLRLSSDLKVREHYPWERIIASGFAARLAADPVRGGLWLGSESGRVAYFSNGQVRESYAVDKGQGRGSVNHLRVAADGTLWVATDRGLSRIKAGRVTTFDSKNGLPCGAVDWSIDDGKGSLWLSTGCGLVRVASSDLEDLAAVVQQGTTAKLRVTVLGSRDGVSSPAYVGTYSPHVAHTIDGKLWFITGGWGGTTVVDVEHLPINNLAPPVEVQQIIADGTAYQPARGLDLPPRVRDLQIHYTAFSFVVPEAVLFRYRLEGHDRDWQDAGNRRIALYTDLPPGAYRFHVIASNNSGVWNEQGDTLDFSIAPAFWQTMWFRTLCVVAFVGLLWMLYQLRLRQVTRAFELGLEARVAERTRIARELHDTLLQSFQGVLLRFQTAVRLLPTRPAEARQVLETTLDQAERAVADGRNAVQGLRSSVVEAADLADAIKTLGEELAADPARDRFIPLRLTVEGTPRKLRAIVRDEIYRIAGEALRNAFRHSGATRIEVELQYDERRFELRVRDDGKGIDAKFLSEEGRAKHFGLSGMRERAEMIGGTLALWTSPNSGTELELKIPAFRAYRASPRRRSWLLERLSTVGGEREP